MVEWEDVLLGFAKGLRDRRDRGSGFDYGDMDAEGAYYSALNDVAHALESAMSDILDRERMRRKRGG